MTGSGIVGPVPPPDLHIMTLNVRRRMGPLDWRRADRWSRREPALGALLASEQPAVLGVQEALPDQAAAIVRALDAAHPRRHRYVGHGRSPGPRGEGCPIFFDSERLDLIDWGQTALSDQPDRPGSRSWGNLIPRVLVRAVFRDRATAAEFVVFNTHLDPFAPTASVRAAAEIRAQAASQHSPVIVLGDLNATAGSPTVDALLAGDVLRDAWIAADERLTPEWATYADYRPPRTASGRRNGRIDWIVASPSIRVRRAAISDRRMDGRWASDHLPVHAVVRLPEPERRS